MIDTISTRSVSDRVRYFEIAAELAPAIGKIICMDILQWRFPFIVAVMIGWATYISIRGRQPGTILLKHYG